VGDEVEPEDDADVAEPARRDEPGATIETLANAAEATIAANRG
jgi:hypothetical protein